MLELYGYQETAVIEVLNHLKTHRRALVVMAPGLGKTVVVASVLQRWSSDRRKRTLFLCHENRILDQACEEFPRILGPKVRYGVFHGERQTQIDADVLFASFRSVLGRKELFVPDAFDCIIVDESHHGVAPTFKEVIDYFRPNDFLLGITATPDRQDEKDIRELFGDEVVHIPLHTAIMNKWLTPLEYFLMSDNLDTRVLKIIAQELNARKRISIKDLNERLFIERRDEEIAKIIENQGGKGIVFCESIRHAEYFQALLAGSTTYHSKKGKAKNQETLQAFRSGNLQYILVVDKFNEGIDIPDANLIVFMRLTDSRRIFLQQLGRGLRLAPNKDKVTILDFVGNCNRLRQLRWLVETMQPTGGQKRDPLKVSGAGFEFNFQPELIQVLDLLDKVTRSLYPTWQEASVAAITLGFQHNRQYRRNYWKDEKLPSHPDEYYPDFPGWPAFLANGYRTPGRHEQFYPTWEEASNAVKRLNIHIGNEYQREYRKDPRLPSNPWIEYPDFPGWLKFFGKERRASRLKSKPRVPQLRYATWQEASISAIALGIKSAPHYAACYKRDPKLPSHPNTHYPDFPGWPAFLNKSYRSPRPAILYQTWQEASQAAIELGIQTGTEYCKGKRYTEDPKLPSSPFQTYADFPGFSVFLGKKSPASNGEKKKKARRKEEIYSTWQEAQVAVIRLGIRSGEAYHKDAYPADEKLPYNPDREYADFPGWKVFLGKSNRSWRTFLGNK